MNLSNTLILNEFAQSLFLFVPMIIEFLLEFSKFEINRLHSFHIASGIIDTSGLKLPYSISGILLLCLHFFLRWSNVKHCLMALFQSTWVENPYVKKCLLTFYPQATSSYVQFSFNLFLVWWWQEEFICSIWKD